jgi:hypothetical protein
MNEDLNNFDLKKKKPKSFEEWEQSHNFKDVDPKVVNEAISKEYGCRDSDQSNC